MRKIKTLTFLILMLGSITSIYAQKSDCWDKYPIKALPDDCWCESCPHGGDFKKLMDCLCAEKEKQSSSSAKSKNESEENEETKEGEKSESLETPINLTRLKSDLYETKAMLERTGQTDTEEYRKIVASINAVEQQLSRKNNSYSGTSNSNQSIYSQTMRQTQREIDRANNSFNQMNSLVNLIFDKNITEEQANELAWKSARSYADRKNKKSEKKKQKELSKLNESIYTQQTLLGRWNFVKYTIDEKDSYEDLPKKKNCLYGFIDFDKGNNYKLFQIDNSQMGCEYNLVNSGKYYIKGWQLELRSENSIVTFYRIHNWYRQVELRIIKYEEAIRHLESKLFLSSYTQPERNLIFKRHQEGKEIIENHNTKISSIYRNSDSKLEKQAVNRDFINELIQNENWESFENESSKISKADIISNEKRIVVANFEMPWCFPCKQNLQTINNLIESGDKVTILVIYGSQKFNDKYGHIAKTQEYINSLEKLKHSEVIYLPFEENPNLLEEFLGDYNQAPNTTIFENGKLVYEITGLEKQEKLKSTLKEFGFN